MKRKKIVVALGHKALGTTLPEQKAAVKRSAKVIADLVAAGADVVITHSNAPQVGMIHMAMNEFGKMHTDYSAAPMSVCSAMSEGYIGYDLQNAIRAELLRRGIFKTTSTILTQVEVDPYDDAFNNPVKLIGRTLTKEEADAEEEKGNYVTKTEDGYRRIVAAPKPQDIVEIDSIRLLLDAGQVVIAAGGGGIPVLPQNEELKGASAVIEKDLTSGSVLKNIFTFSLPYLLSYFLQTLYGMADLFLVPSSMLSTVSALGAQNIGAGKYDRVDKILRYAIAIGVGFGAVMALLMQFIAPSVVRPFTSDEAVVKAGAAYIRSYIFDCLFAGIQFSFSGYFCAWGRSGLSFLHNTLSILMVRVPGAWLACRFFPQTLVPMGLAPACGSLFSSIVCILLYRWMKRQNKPTGDKD